MGVNYNPRIVTDGLVLNLDAGNRKSYPGSGTTWTDMSQFRNNATFVNNPTFSASNSGQIIFNGTTQYGSIASVSGVTDFTISNNYSIDFWVFINSVQNDLSNVDHSIVEKWSAGGVNAYPYVFRYDRPTGKIYLAAYNGTTVVGPGRLTIETNRWNHVCGGFRWTTSTAFLYLNGGESQSVTQVSLTGTINNSQVLSLMRRGNGFNYTTGRLAGLKIYNRALTAEEVKRNYYAIRGRFGV